MPIRFKPLPSAGRVRQLLSYNPETGDFRWLVSSNPKQKVGAIAGSVGKTGYRRIAIDGIDYQAHRLAWLHYYGTEPKNELDHINRVLDDNRISNLRGASRSQNMANKIVRNSTGLKCIRYAPDSPLNPWSASITVSGKCIQLGHFPTVVQAASAYIEAAKKYHGEFASADYRVINGRLRRLLTAQAL